MSASRKASAAATARPPPADSPASAMFARRDPLREKPLVGGPCVVDRSRKRILGRQTVVDGHDLGAGPLGQLGGQRH